MENQPSGFRDQALHAAEMSLSSVVLAWPPSAACSAMREFTIRSAHMPPHQARSSGLEWHQIDALGVTSTAPAAWAQASSRRPASGSVPLARATA